MAQENAFVHRAASGGCYALMVFLCVFPIIAIGSFLPQAYRAAAGGVVLAVALMAGFLWITVRRETRLELGPSSLRLTEQESFLGMKQALTVVWELPIAELTHVKEVHSRTPSSRGGWNHGYSLVFPGERVIRDGLFGSRDDGSSPYRAIVRWLEERLGERFTREEKV